MEHQHSPRILKKNQTETFLEYVRLKFALSKMYKKELVCAPLLRSLHFGSKTRLGGHQNCQDGK